MKVTAAVLFCSTIV